VTEPVYLPPLNSDQALQKRDEIDALLGSINAHELKLAHSYARLGSLLRTVKNEQYWIAYGYERFSSYLQFICEKINRQRSQVYAILTVAETLLPHLSEDQLQVIGINKAHELRRLVKEGGTITAWTHSFENGPEGESIRLMDYAADPKVTAAQLRIKVNELLHAHEGPKGNWIDLGGFYLDAGERKEVEDFWGQGRQVLELGSEQSDHVWKKQVFLAAVRECLGSWV
jgi:hypothetical protein